MFGVKIIQYITIVIIRHNLPKAGENMLSVTFAKRFCHARDRDYNTLGCAKFDGSEEMELGGREGSCHSSALGLKLVHLCSRFKIHIRVLVTCCTSYHSLFA